MIIDAKTVLLTLTIIGVATYFGLGAIRSFALSIAQENHDANLAMDMTEEARRAKRQRDADAAATAAFAKVEPLLPASVLAGNISSSSQVQIAAATELPASAPSSAPSSGNGLNMGALNVGGAKAVVGDDDNEGGGDEENQNLEEGELSDIPIISSGNN